MRILLGLVALGLVPACDPVANTPDAGPAGADASPMPPDAEADRDHGIVIIAEQLDPANPTPRSTAAASFFDGPLFDGPDASGGGCNFYNAPNETGLSAGPIDVTGTSAPIMLVPSSASPPVMYSPMPNPPPADLFAPGDSITMTAAGSEVPAFTGSVVAPAVIEGAAFPAAVSRATGGTVTWTARTADEMWLWLAAPSQAGTIDLLWCRMPDSGSFAIPPAGVALFPASATSVGFILWRVNARSVNAGNWSVALSVASSTPGPVGVPLEP